MEFLDGTRPLLLCAAIIGLGGGAFLWWRMVRRLGRAVFGRAQPPVGTVGWLARLTLGVVLLAVGAAALGLWSALAAYRDLSRRTHFAEVQCIALASTKLRVYYVPIERDGRRGATETYDVDGDEWTVGGDILRFRPLVSHLGVDTVFQVTRVEGRWLTAADANQHKGTAHDRGTTGRGWLALYRDGARGPLGWLVAGAHGQAVSQLPDRRAVYDLYATPNGFVVDKRTF
jgi:hypothetical protein